MSRTALIIVTSHGLLGSTGGPTGYWKEELVVPYRRFRAAGFGVDVASVAGGQPPVDPASEPLDAPDVDLATQATAPLAAVDADHYAAVLLVGGHGTMWDFSPNPTLEAIVSTIASSGVVASVCHGAAGLIGTVGADGSPLIAGRIVTAFSDAEETAVGTGSLVPFSLERRLAELGARVENGEPFQPNVRQHGRLVTGQNPASSALVADLVVETLSVGAGR